MGGEAIGGDEVATAEGGVIACSLAQGLLVDGDIRLLALDDNKRLSIRAYSDDIGTLRHAVNIHGVLLDNLLGKEATLATQILHNVSAYPLLGGEHKPASAPAVEDLGAAISASACPEPYGRKM